MVESTPLTDDLQIHFKLHVATALRSLLDQLIFKHLKPVDLNQSFILELVQLLLHLIARTFRVYRRLRSLPLNVLNLNRQVLVDAMHAAKLVNGHPRRPLSLHVEWLLRYLD